MRDFLISVTASLFNSDALQPAKGVEEHREDLLRLKKLIFMQTSKLQGSLVAVAAVSILAGATTMWSLSFTVGKCHFLSSFLWLNVLVLLQVPLCPYYTNPFCLTYGLLAILVLLQEKGHGMDRKVSVLT